MEAFVVLFLICLMLVLLVYTKIASDFVFLGILALLTVFPVIDDGKWKFGILSVNDALSGFSNPGLITIAFLYIVANGLRHTGAIDWIGQVFLGRPKTVQEAVTRVTLPVMGLSSFLNNTTCVAMMVPVVSDLCKRAQFSPSKLMLPLNYAAVLGGTCTLIGTSTNLVVNGLLITEAKLPSLGLFDISAIGVPCALIGAIFLIFIGHRLLPDKGSSKHQFENPREYTVEMVLPEGSSLAGKTINQAGLRNLPSLFLVEVTRDDEVAPAVNPEFILKKGDRLLFTGIVDSVKELANQRGLVPATNQLFKLSSPRHWRQLYEVVVSNTSPLTGKTIKEAKFRTYYGAVVIAVARNSERIKKKIGDIVISAGDTLLIEATSSFYERFRDSRDFLLISPLEDSTPRSHERAPLAIGILFLLIISVLFNIFDMLQASMIAAFLTILSRCSTITQARRSLDFNVLLIIAASLGIGKAIETSGLAHELVNLLTTYVKDSPVLGLIAIYIVTLLLTEIITNNAAAAFIFPIALQLADGLGVSVIPYAIAIMMAASSGFATPFGYQTNLMVYGPGGYKYSDYLKIGIPMDIIIGTAAILLIIYKWNFI